MNASPTPGREHSPAGAGGGLRRLFFFLLTADVAFTLIDQIEPKILPIILKLHGASNQQIAIIVSSIAAAMQFFVTPILGYRSDRKHSRWGRRMPYMFWAAPLVSLTLAVTPYAPEIAERALRLPGLARGMQALPIAPVILAFGLIAVVYRFGHAVLSTMYFCLFRDVVPMSHMGRFLSLYRIFGALSTFALAYWLLGLAETHAKPIFLGVAAVNLVGFLLLFCFVREPAAAAAAGNRPAPVSDSDGGGGWQSVRTFVAESYTQPIYWWTYCTRLLIYGAVPISGFMVFFPLRELGLTLDRVGKLTSISSLGWLVIAYPIGCLIDRIGAIPVLLGGLGLATSVYLGSFFFVVGTVTFFLSALITGLMFWVIMLGQLALAQEIFHPARYAQLSSAGILVQSLAIAVLISPLLGWSLDRLHGVVGAMHLPWVGAVALGPYRFVNLMMAAAYGLALAALWRVRRHWRALGGGAGGYVAPL